MAPLPLDGEKPRVCQSRKVAARGGHRHAALERELDEVFDDTTLADLRDRGKHVLVAAFCLTTGRARIFNPDPAIAV